ncbi:hypothetical protein MKW94_021070 [Papaver nudicaule]|uniref:MADS-box domain-containing protein n=1 Tax=Papaver nudicaule TaxID=74823 RepID=A0AA41SLC5_PAPNU|nr:hypothetical protein [Papaver nudicaule]
MKNDQLMVEMKKDRKGGIGRRKIKIEKIQNKSRLQVTFCKRRKGLFKKAEELTALCGAEIGLIAFSPAGNPFVCGNPNLLINQFVNNNKDENQLCEFDEQRWIMEVEKEEEVEKNRGISMESLINSNLGDNPDDRYWWDTYIDGLSLGELKQMRSDMEQIKMFVEKRSHELMNVPSSSSSSSYEDDANAIDDDDFVPTVVSNSIGQIPQENGYGIDGYFGGSTNQDDFVCCDYSSSGCDDYENSEMLNELLSGFHQDNSADMVF